MMSESQRPPALSLRRILPLIAIAAIAVAGFFFRDVFSFETLAGHREQLLAWRDSSYALVVLGYMAAYFAVVAFSLPGALIMTLAGGFLFGLFPGALYIVVAATLGAIAIFLAAKTGLGDALHQKMQASGGGMAARFEKGLRENEVSYLLLMRLVPAVPFFIANLAPAFFGVGLITYAWTTFVGILPGTIVYTWVGAGLGEVFETGGTPDLGILFEWQVLGPILGLCALSALPIVLKTLRKKGAE